MLLKMKFPYEAVMGMNKAEAEAYLEAWLELNGETKRKKVYRRRSRKGKD